jgi:excisionase family DNA binding protein
MKQSQLKANGPHHVPPQTPASGASISFSERLTCTIAEACEATGLGRTKLYELIGSGDVETATIGRRRLVKVRSLRRLLKMEGD